MRLGSVLTLRCECQHIQQTCMCDFFTIVTLRSDGDRDGVWANHRPTLPPACSFKCAISPERSGSRCRAR